ncbi:MAG: hypothetical protein CL920_17205 [Deltaproteobacteria bacterium]|nr:hypothetical protein [Deltaproteobacteria bacterium]|tara:strand:+ start:25109 stop:28324 length:3216 start_codon:yes stop_codon:yes gene_type:complete
MKRLLSILSLGAIFAFAPPIHAAKKAKKAKKVKKKVKKKRAIGFAILSFEESGKISVGTGKTLSMILHGSLNARQFRLIDPVRVNDLLDKYHWKQKHQLTDELLRALKKRGVSHILTGTVSRHYGTFTSTYRLVTIKGRILRSEVLPPVQSWVGLVSTLKYSVKLLIERSAKSSKGKRASRLRRLAKKLLKKKKKKGYYKPFKKFIKNARRIKGLFPIYVQKMTDGSKRTYLEVHPKQLGKMFLLSPTLEGGTGGSIITFAMLPEFPFILKRQASKLLMIHKNTNFRVSKKAAVSRIFNRSFTHSLKTVAKIISAPHPKRKSFLINLNDFMMKDLAGLRYWVRRQLQKDRNFRVRRRSVYGIDKRYSTYYSLKGFPKNIEVGVKAYFRALSRGRVDIPSGQGVRLFLRYSISTPPDTGYKPRLADDRVGYFMKVAKDFTNDRVDSRFVRYITRWHLEKKEPSSKMSEPKKPITFWLENGIPYKYRSAIAKGILVWNKAFERIGFKRAVRVFQQPAKAKWDPADVRYSTIRWFLANNSAFAQGPSRIHPLTGQIYDADIRMSADMVKFVHQQFEQYVSPVRWIRPAGLDIFFDPSARTRSLNALQKRLQQIDVLTKKPHNHEHGWRSCQYTKGAMQQATLGWHLLNMRGKMAPSSMEEKKFMEQFLISVVAHEVGHTLGLRHNFKASTLHDYKGLHDAKKTVKEGLTNSMMEYAPVNLALPGDKQGEYWQTTLGPYDYWAIEYGYKPLKAKTPKDELPVLKKIASRVADPKLAYATDEDAFMPSSPYSIDPYAMRWDMGRDPIRYFDNRLKLSRELWKKAEKTFEKKGASYQKLRNVFMIGLGSYLRSGMQASKFVGGLVHKRVHVGDPGKQLPFTPLDVKKQRKALKFMVDNYFARELKWSPSLLNKLGPNRLRGFSWMKIFFSRVEVPINRMVVLVQVLPLYRLFHPAVLERIQDNTKRVKGGSNPLTLAELFGTVQKAIWAELSEKGPVKVSLQRRNLQRFHLELLVAYSLTTSTITNDASALARHQLKKLKAQIDGATKRAKDTMTKAHLETAAARIAEILKVSFIRF